MNQVTFQRGDVIFKEGEYQNWMYSICEGAVDICSGLGTPQEKKLATLTKDQFFGEIGMIAFMPRTAAAVAAEAVVLEQISMEDLEGYLKNHPENLQPIMKSVSGRLRELTGDLSEVTGMIREALDKKGSGNAAAAWLAESVRNMLAKLKAGKPSIAEQVIQQKRQQALSGKNAPLVRYAKGDVLFRAGEPSDCMYHIYDGFVGIYADYQTANEKQLANLDSDSVFGEMGILDDMPRSATAVCLSDCAILLVNQEQFQQYFQDQPAKILKILQQMCIQLRDLTKNYLEICKTLENLPAEEEEFREDLAWQQLEYIRQSQLCASLYDNCLSSEWYYI